MEKRKTRSLGIILFAFVCSLLMFGSTEKKSGILVYTADDSLLRNYEKSDKQFVRLEIGEYIVYYHQRTVGEAVVEKDFTIYQLDLRTKKLLNCRRKKRDGVPEFDCPVITKEEAESMAFGEVLFSRLLIISPESDVFPFDPVPQNPCWIVRYVFHNHLIVSVIDAMTGEYLGDGIPPPQKGYAFSGPVYSRPSCSGSWDTWRENAARWFEKWFYPTESDKWPTKWMVKEKVQDPAVKVIYEFGHGGSYDFISGCHYGTRGWEVEEWITDFPKKKFVFLGHCDGLCSSGKRTLSNAYRKGSMVGTATVGYCDMSSSECFECWNISWEWQDMMFEHIYYHGTVREAFIKALIEYPMCSECVRFVGDARLTLNLSPPVIDMKIFPKTEFAWSIRKYYALILLEIENEYSPKYPKYKLLRKADGGAYIEIKDIQSTDEKTVYYEFTDDLPSGDVSYTYRVGILNPEGEIIAYSEEVTISPQNRLSRRLR